MNFYAILGITPEADDDAIRIAFRALARRYHPDMGDGSSTEKFRQVTEAYETLIDPQRRRTYDRSIHRPLPTRVPIEPITAWPSVQTFGAPLRPDPDLDWIFEEWLAWMTDDLAFFSRRRRR
jgi:curved DNA-binding protein CbpA